MQFSNMGTLLPGDDIFLQTFITHDWSSDMTIVLISPSGTTVLITSQQGGSYDDIFFGTVWYDGAPPVDTYSFSGNGVVSPLGPQQPFSTFWGESIDGNWTLLVTDAYTVDPMNFYGFAFDGSFSFLSSFKQVKQGNSFLQIPM